MNIVEAILISVGLAMDAFAVSICKGLTFKKMDYKKGIIIGLWFGFFQAFMPSIGFILGKSFESIITSIDHYVAFVLLLLIGANMIKGAFTDEDDDSIDGDTGFKTMLLLSIATSIDALAIGIAYVCAYGSVNVVRTFSLIGIITFIISFIGVIIGSKFGKKFQNKAEFCGGLILILLGVKILVEHLGIL